VPARPTATFFATPADFRTWLEEHHAEAVELWVGYHKKGTGKPSITWPESVDQALCFGWIDGVRRSLDAARYAIRFTPRRPRSVWSAINVARVKALRAQGLMTPAGLAAFGKRDEERSGIYSFEQPRAPELDPAMAQRLRGNKTAWTFFQAQAPWYRRSATHWVVSAKKEETRERRLATLIECSERGRRIPPLDPARGR
jgi:uncharacterized protein YdeI (YjbR/CyaY-like superfamily)